MQETTTNVGEFINGSFLIDPLDFIKVLGNGKFVPLHIVKDFINNQKKHENTPNGRHLLARTDR